jgi:outer membrane lipoprotein-sorting protein
MIKLLLVGALFALTLSACEQQKQASAEVGAIPKEILDKAKSEINAAEAAAVKQAKALENIETPSDEAK